MSATILTDNPARAENPVLAIALSAAVPLRIRAYQEQGGPQESDRERVRSFARVLGEKGDVLQYGSKKSGEAAELFNRLSDALAVLAFQPGGVVFAGERWEANKTCRDER